MFIIIWIYKALNSGLQLQTVTAWGQYARFRDFGIELFRCRTAGLEGVL